MWPHYNHENADRAQIHTLYDHGELKTPGTFRLEALAPSKTYKDFIETVEVPPDMDITLPEYEELCSKVYSGSDHASCDFAFASVKSNDQQRLVRHVAQLGDPMVRFF